MLGSVGGPHTSDTMYYTVLSSTVALLLSAGRMERLIFIRRAWSAFLSAPVRLSLGLEGYVYVCGKFYEQTELLWGSLLARVIACFFMEDFYEMAFAQATHKPLCWFSYVDDTFVFWSLGTETFERLLDHSGARGSTVG